MIDSRARLRSAPSPTRHPACACHATADARPCIHIRAAAKHAGFTHQLRREAAAFLVATGEIKVDEEEGLYSAPQLAACNKAAYCRPREGRCTCHDRARHGICCHLMAAALLPGEQRVELTLTVELAAPAAEDEMQVGVGLDERWRSA